MPGGGSWCAHGFMLAVVDLFLWRNNKISGRPQLAWNRAAAGKIRPVQRPFRHQDLEHNFAYIQFLLLCRFFTSVDGNVPHASIK